ncbi:hypothetical protein TSMEX_000458 [Taenia solium]|eukprot:TsM_000719900 transcript=TsM_000719900 gene=TsM_000719900
MRALLGLTDRTRSLSAIATSPRRNAAEASPVLTRSTRTQVSTWASRRRPRPRKRSAVVFTACLDTYRSWNTPMLLFRFNKHYHYVNFLLSSDTMFF